MNKGPNTLSAFVEVVLPIGLPRPSISRTPSRILQELPRAVWLWNRAISRVHARGAFETYIYPQAKRTGYFSAQSLQAQNYSSQEGVGIRKGNPAFLLRDQTESSFFSGAMSPSFSRPRICDRDRPSSSTTASYIPGDEYERYSAKLPALNPCQSRSSLVNSQCIRSASHGRQQF